ncbi:putative sugar lactone lactonase YvrE [Belonocnema kinseyi]|uniref:putative sugar lactone lactonase YvrE n=1 Tax=Belonocnema kinseyi TaxID=2817044 RepID=UPI00143E07D0|nr:putative sugar lactone lactonase YvrE [Belonocnema kinseyi]
MKSILQILERLSLSEDRRGAPGVTAAGRNMRGGDDGTGFISFAVPVHNIPHLYLVSYDKKLAFLTWNSHRNSVAPFFEIVQDAQGVPVGENEIHEDRMSYGTIDPHGRLWFGTMNNRGPPRGSVWSYNPIFPPHLTEQFNKPNLRPHRHEGNNYSNGISWFIKRGQPTKVYYNDALSNKIQLYLYDLINGVLENFVETIFDLNQFHQYGINGSQCHMGRMTTDVRDWLWVPLIGGSGVLEIDPYEKQVHRFIPIPAHAVTACAFGGVDGSTLYVTTLGSGPRQRGPNADQGGEIFAVSRLGLGVFGTEARGFLSTQSAPNRIQN